MCTNNLYNVTKNLKYKKTYENGQITHYLEHRGMVTGLVREKKNNTWRNESLPYNSTTRPNRFNIKYNWITE